MQTPAAATKHLENALISRDCFHWK